MGYVVSVLVMVVCVCSHAGVVDAQTVCTNEATRLVLELYNELSGPNRASLDLVFLVDQSASVQESAGVIAAIISSLVTYVTRNCTAQFAPSADHIALIPFGMAANSVSVNTYDGITDTSLSSNVCDFLQFVSELEQRTMDVRTSRGDDILNFVSALDQTADILQRSVTSQQQDYRLQVVIVFHDGETPISDLANEMSYDTDLNASLARMDAQCISMYSVALCEWLDDQAELERMRRIASSEDHFAFNEVLLADMQGMQGRRPGGYWGYPYLSYFERNVCFWK